MEGEILVNQASMRAEEGGANRKGFSVVEGTTTLGSNSASAGTNVERKMVKGKSKKKKRTKTLSPTTRGNDAHGDEVSLQSPSAYVRTSLRLKNSNSSGGSKPKIHPHSSFGTKSVVDKLRIRTSKSSIRSLKMIADDRNNSNAQNRKRSRTTSSNSFSTTSLGAPSKPVFSSVQLARKAYAKQIMRSQPVSTEHYMEQPQSRWEVENALECEQDSFDSMSDIRFGDLNRPQMCSYSQLSIAQFIIERERKLTQLERLVNEIRLSRSEHSAGYNVEIGKLILCNQNFLQHIAELRCITVSVVEGIMQWRKNEGSYEKPFGWQGHNYVLKMARSLDFLASILSPYLQSVQIFIDLLRNPFVLTCSLSSSQLVVVACKNNKLLLDLFASTLKTVEEEVSIKQSERNGTDVEDRGLQGEKTNVVYTTLNTQRITQCMLLLLNEEMNQEACHMNMNSRYSSMNIPFTDFTHSRLSDVTRTNQGGMERSKQNADSSRKQETTMVNSRPFRGLVDEPHTCVVSSISGIEPFSNIPSSSAPTTTNIETLCSPTHEGYVSSQNWYYTGHYSLQEDSRIRSVVSPRTTTEFEVEKHSKSSAFARIAFLCDTVKSSLEKFSTENSAKQELGMVRSEGSENFEERRAQHTEPLHIEEVDYSNSCEEEEDDVEFQSKDLSESSTGIISTIECFPPEKSTTHKTKASVMPIKGPVASSAPFRLLSEIDPLEGAKRERIRMLRAGWTAIEICWEKCLVATERWSIVVRKVLERQKKEDLTIAYRISVKYFRLWHINSLFRTQFRTIRQQAHSRCRKLFLERWRVFSTQQISCRSMFHAWKKRVRLLKWISLHSSSHTTFEHDCKGPERSSMCTPNNNNNGASFEQKKHRGDNCKYTETHAVCGRRGSYNRGEKGFRERIRALEGLPRVLDAEQLEFVYRSKVYASYFENQEDDRERSEQRSRMGEVYQHICGNLSFYYERSRMTACACFSAWKEWKRGREVEKYRHRALVKIQTQWKVYREKKRGLLWRENMSMLKRSYNLRKQSAMRIQMGWKLYCERKKYLTKENWRAQIERLKLLQKDNEEEKLVQEHRRKNVEDHTQRVKNENESAEVISRYCWSYISMKRKNKWTRLSDSLLEIRQRSAIVVQLAYRKRRLKRIIESNEAMRLTEDHSARIIQTFFRANFAKRTLHSSSNNDEQRGELLDIRSLSETRKKLENAEHTAAISIQICYRMYCHRIKPQRISDVCAYTIENKILRRIEDEYFTQYKTKLSFEQRSLHETIDSSLNEEKEQLEINQFSAVKIQNVFRKRTAPQVRNANDNEISANSIVCDENAQFGTAALKIQRFYYRKRAESTARRETRRIIIEKERKQTEETVHKCATKLQKWIRLRCCEKALKIKTQNQSFKNACIKVQRAYRRFRAKERKTRKIHESARVLQCWIRWKVGEKRRKATRENLITLQVLQEEKEKDQREAFALRMMNSFRKKKLRRQEEEADERRRGNTLELIKRKCSVRVIQRAFRAHIAKSKAFETLRKLRQRQRRREEEKKRKLIECLKQEQCASRIQSWYTRHKTLRVMCTIEKQRDDVRASQSQNESRSDKGKKPKRDKSARIIQRAFRSVNKLRRNLKLRNNEAKVDSMCAVEGNIERSLRERLGGDLSERNGTTRGTGIVKESCACKIQVWYREMAKIKRVEDNNCKILAQNSELAQTSVLRIQSAYLRSRSKCRELAESDDQRKYLESLRREEKSARILQTFFKKVEQEKRLSDTQKHENWHAVRIQRCWKGFISAKRLPTERTDFVKLKRAVLRIQKAIRLHRQRLRILQYYEDIQQSITQSEEENSLFDGKEPNEEGKTAVLWKGYKEMHLITWEVLLVYQAHGSWKNTGSTSDSSAFGGDESGNLFVTVSLPSVASGIPNGFDRSTYSVELGDAIRENLLGLFRSEKLAMEADLALNDIVDRLEFTQEVTKNDDQIGSGYIELRLADDCAGLLSKRLKRKQTMERRVKNIRLERSIVQAIQCRSLEDLELCLRSNPEQVFEIDEQSGSNIFHNLAANTAPECVGMLKLVFEHLEKRGNKDEPTSVYIPFQEYRDRVESLINSTNKNHQTPLMIAVKEGNLRAVDSFIQSSSYLVDIDFVCPFSGVNSLWYAIEEDQLEICGRLLEYGADFQQKLTVKGKCALHFAVEKGMVECFELLWQKYQKHGADPTQTFDGNMRNILMYALEFNQLKLMRQILSHVVHVEQYCILINHYDGSGKNILHYIVCSRNSERYLEVLLEMSKRFLDGFFGSQPGVHVADRFYWNSMQIVLQVDKMDHQGNNCIHTLCSLKGKEKVLLMLLQMGIPFDACNSDGETATDVAKWSQNNDYIKIITDFCAENDPFDPEVSNEALEITKRNETRGFGGIQDDDEEEDEEVIQIEHEDNLDLMSFMEQPKSKNANNTLQEEHHSTSIQTDSEAFSDEISPDISSSFVESSDAYIEYGEWPPTQDVPNTQERNEKEHDEVNTSGDGYQAYAIDMNPSVGLPKDENRDLKYDLDQELSAESAELHDSDYSSHYDINHSHREYSRSSYYQYNCDDNYSEVGSTGGYNIEMNPDESQYSANTQHKNNYSTVRADNEYTSQLSSHREVYEPDHYSFDELSSRIPMNENDHHAYPDEETGYEINLNPSRLSSRESQYSDNGSQYSEYVISTNAENLTQGMSDHGHSVVSQISSQTQQANVEDDQTSRDEWYGYSSHAASFYQPSGYGQDESQQIYHENSCDMYGYNSQEDYYEYQ